MDLNTFFQLFISDAYKVQRFFNPQLLCFAFETLQSDCSYLITDNIQQINKISSLVYYLDLIQLFIFLASSFQYVLIYATVFFMLQVKFRLKYKRALMSGLNNSL